MYDDLTMGEVRTRMLLAAVAGDSADDGVLLSGYAVGCAFGPTLGAGGVVFALALSVLHASAVSGAAETEHVADLRVALAEIRQACRLKGRRTVSFIEPFFSWNWPEVLDGDEDMMMICLFRI